jgi:hypothetical protein
VIAYNYLPPNAFAVFPYAAQNHTQRLLSLRTKLRSCSTENVTFLLMAFPVLRLTFWRAIVRPTTSSTREQGSAFHHSFRMATGRIRSPAHLFDRFDFFLFLIQARAGNTFPKVADECVFICTEEFSEFHWIKHCFGSPQRNIYQLLQVKASY